MTLITYVVVLYLFVGLCHGLLVGLDGLDRIYRSRGIRPDALELAMYWSTVLLCEAFAWPWL